MVIFVNEYNVSDTKKYYCDINAKVLSGMEIVTIKSKTKEKISHIKKDYLDFLLDRLKFTVNEEFDEELKGWTVWTVEVPMYGEGKTRDEAIDDLINSLVEFSEIYINEIEIFSKTESTEKQVYMLKILRCNGNKEMIARELGINNAN